MTFEDQLAGARSGTEIIPGFADTYPDVIIGGVSQAAVWNDHVYANRGEPVTVARVRTPDGPFENRVIGRVGRPGADTGVILSTDGTSALVSVGAEEVHARYDPAASYAPSDEVALSWQGSLATVLFKVTSFLPPGAPAPPTAPPPGGATSGTLKPLATDSATWVPGLGAWNKWATQNQGVWQGSYGGNTTYGAWWYNGATKQLAGATIDRVQLRIPKRLNVGAYNSDITLHVYVHSSDTRPAGDVTRILGPFDLPIPANHQGGNFDLPTAAGDLLKSGGGIAIAGEPYAGVVGKFEDISSGQLFIDWHR